MVSEARRKAAEAAANAPGGRRPFFSGGMLDMATGALGSAANSPWANLIRDAGGQAVGALGGGINAFPRMLMGAWLQAGQFMGRNGGMAPAGVGLRGIAAQDPLSREGNAQRVRSLAQNQMMKIGKQQLDEQKKTRVAVEKIAANQPQRAPANLAGG